MEAPCKEAMEQSTSRDDLLAALIKRVTCEILSINCFARCGSICISSSEGDAIAEETLIRVIRILRQGFK